MRRILEGSGRFDVRYERVSRNERNGMSQTDTGIHRVRWQLDDASDDCVWVFTKREVWAGRTRIDAPNPDARATWASGGASAARFSVPLRSMNAAVATTRYEPAANSDEQPPFPVCTRLDALEGEPIEGQGLASQLNAYDDAGNLDAVLGSLEAQLAGIAPTPGTSQPSWRLERFDVCVGDGSIAERIQNALRHAITQCGGATRTDPF